VRSGGPDPFPIDRLIFTAGQPGLARPEIFLRMDSELLDETHHRGLIFPLILQIDEQNTDAGSGRTARDG